MGLGGMFLFSLLWTYVKCSENVPSGLLDAQKGFGLLSNKKKKWTQDNYSGVN